jgi:hypothetical protein
MTLTEDLTRRAAELVGRRTSRRDFLGRTALVGSALTVAGSTYVLWPGTAYAQVTRTSASTSSSAPATRARHRRSSRMRTRGKPSSTDSVSAIFVKPACSNSARVPT